MCMGSAVSRRTQVLGGCPPFPCSQSILFYFLQSSCSSDKNDWKETSHLELSVQGLSLSVQGQVVSDCIIFHLLQKEVSLMITEEDPDL